MAMVLGAHQREHHHKGHGHHRAPALRSLRWVHSSLAPAHVAERGGDGLDVLESVGDAVWGRGGGGVANGQRNRGDVGDCGEELGLDVFLGDVENLGRVDGATIVAVDHIETVGEGRNFEHVQKGGGGLSNLVASVDEVDKKIQDCIDQARKFNSNEVLVGKETTDYKQLFGLAKDFLPYSNMWKTARTWFDGHKKWMTSAWEELDAPELE